MSNLSDGYKIAFLIREINSKLNNCIKDEFKDSGLTVPQITVIKLLAKHKRLKSSEISKKMSLVNSTVTGIIDRLEKLNIVKRERSEEDKRIVYIELSDTGNIVLEDFRDTINNYFTNIFSNASKEEIDNILTGLETLKEVLD